MNRAVSNAARKRRFAACAALVAATVLLLGGVGLRRAEENRREAGRLRHISDNVGELEKVALQIQIYWNRLNLGESAEEGEVAAGILGGLQDKRTLYMEWLEDNAHRELEQWMGKLYAYHWEIDRILLDTMLHAKEPQILRREIQPWFLDEQELCRDLRSQLRLEVLTHKQDEERYMRLFAAAAGISPALLAAALLIVCRWPAPEQAQALPSI